MTMTKNELRKLLVDSVSEAEIEFLLQGKELIISSFNRQIMLELLQTAQNPETPVDYGRVEALSR